MDYASGLKKEVAEVKFLIHDLRVESFFNEVIHYHVTVNTDLEIHSVDQAQLLHETDLSELKAKARDVRRALQEYSSAVKGFSPDKTVLLAGKAYLEAVWDLCELILNPLWAGSTRSSPSFPRLPLRAVPLALPELPALDLRGLLPPRALPCRAGGPGRPRGVRRRRGPRGLHANVVYGYVMEKGSARVELRLDLQGPGVLGGNRHRFRRMYFNLVMNAVDAMAGRKVGVLHVSSQVEGDRLVLRVSDTGSGMPPEKIENLLAEKESLDGELHSLGFVFVRQTVAELGGTLEIGSEEGKGTTVTLRFPYLPDAVAPPHPPSRCEKYGQTEEDDRGHVGTIRERRGSSQADRAARGGGRVGCFDPRGLPGVRIASPGKHLRHGRDR